VPSQTEVSLSRKREAPVKASFSSVALGCSWKVSAVPGSTLSVSARVTLTVPTADNTSAMVRVFSPSVLSVV